MNHEEDFEVIMKSEEAFYRAKALYQTGITNIGQVWTMLLQKYKAVYGRFPSPEELKSFRSFTAYYATKLGESPSFLANAITSGMKESGAKQALKIDDSGEVHIGGKALAVAQRKATISFRTTTNIQVSVINGYCPAVSMIPKIAEMCCEAFEAGYADVYSLDYK